MRVLRSRARDGGPDLQPGPQVLEGNPQLFWGFVASMWIGNLLLVILILPLIAIWVKLLTVEYKLLYPAILVLCCIGVYSVRNSAFLLYLTACVRLPRLTLHEARMRADAGASRFCGHADESSKNSEDFPRR